VSPVEVAVVPLGVWCVAHALAPASHSRTYPSTATFTPPAAVPETPVQLIAICVALEPARSNTGALS
jgi:hypothetical protein